MVIHINVPSGNKRDKQRIAKRPPLSVRQKHLKKGTVPQRLRDRRFGKPETLRGVVLVRTLAPCSLHDKRRFEPAQNLAGKQ
jgi:hypothetical protein